MMVKQVFSYKVKEGAFKILSSILNHPEQVDPRIDGQVCRITVTSYSVNKCLRMAHWETYKNDRLYQIKIKDIDDKEFLVLESLLEPLDAVILS